MRRLWITSVILGISLLCLWISTTLFLCCLVLLGGIAVVMVHAKQEWKAQRNRINMELERAHRDPSEYDWRPWTKPDYWERRRR